jgi:hypothetical protein
MVYRSKDYLEEISRNETWRKVFSPQHLNQLLDFLEEQQWLPSQVTVDRALAQLKFQRTDGGNEAKDRKAAVAAAQQRLQAVIAEVSAPPLTRTEMDEFAGLSFADLQRRYWSDEGVNNFRFRYDLAAQQHGFRVPSRPSVEA